MIVLLRDQHWNSQKNKIKSKTFILLSQQQDAAPLIDIRFGIIPMTNIPWNVIWKCLKTRETIIFQINIIILFLKENVIVSYYSLWSHIQLNIHTSLFPSQLPTMIPGDLLLPRKSFQACYIFPPFKIQNGISQ